MKRQRILGISAFYHDSAAALVDGDQVAAAAQEERFSRIKHDAHFPAQSIAYCLRECGVSMQELDAIVYYDKPFLTFERLLETYLSFAPKGLLTFLNRMPVWIKEKLTLKQMLRKQLADIAGCKVKDLPPLLFTTHHQSHAASAFFPSPFEKAAVLCLDGVGEWATTSVWLGDGQQLKPLWQLNFPHSLGLLYSAFTFYCGFKVNSGEYKLMGLAPYGKPVYSEIIKDKLIDICADGTFRLNLEYFDYCVGDTMTSAAFDKLFGAPPAAADSEYQQRCADLAASIQLITEEVIMKLSATIQKETGASNLCLSGGVALNCTANGKLARSGLFENIWVQPAAGDAGGAIGAALCARYEYFENDRKVETTDSMRGSYLGPSYSDLEIERVLQENKAQYQYVEDDILFRRISQRLVGGHIVGWFQGRMEFGPRALGNRSILGDPRNAEMQSKLNLKIKFRESFRPFAPSILAEEASAYFDIEGESPYMLITSPVLESRRQAGSDEKMSNCSGLEKLQCRRSEVPAVTHIDYSARLQTVSRESNLRYHRLIAEFAELTQCPMLINTSFNVRGEPIVLSPADAFRCFMQTEMDCLVMGNFVLEKKEQKDYAEKYSLDQRLGLD